MSQSKFNKIKQEVKEKELAKMRYQWFKEYSKNKNALAVCRKFGITRSRFYYWKKRIDLLSSDGKHLTSKILRLTAYSRKPKTNPREYDEKIIKLILKIRKRTNRGAEHIWFTLKDKYAIHLSVTGIYKVLKREGLIKERRHKQKLNKIYEAPKYLPGEKVQIDLKYVKLVDEIAKMLGKKYGYEHKLIPPAYPRANSHVERTHRVDEKEVYRGRTFTSLIQLHKINLKTLKYFNEKRPQKSKHFLSPLNFGTLNFRLHKQKLNYTVLNV